MKKLLALAVVAGGVLFAVKRKKGKSQVDAEAWRESTAPLNGASLNGNAKLADSARKN